MRPNLLFTRTQDHTITQSLSGVSAPTHVGQHYDLVQVLCFRGHTLPASVGGGICRRVQLHEVTKGLPTVLTPFSSGQEWKDKCTTWCTGYCTGPVWDTSLAVGRNRRLISLSQLQCTKSPVRREKQRVPYFLLFLSEGRKKTTGNSYTDWTGEGVYE